MRPAFESRLRALTLLILCIVLAACTLPGRSTPTATQTASPLPLATLTSTPPAPLVILVLPPDMPKDETNQYETATYNLAQQYGMRFQVRNSLTPVDINQEGPALKIVIAFSPDPGLAALSAAAPQAQFLAVGIPALKAAPNLSSIGASGPPSDKQAFLAGYIAGMVSNDYRIGIITLKGDPQGMAAEAAFSNGMHFYCGLCNPAFPPWYPYPIHIEIPSDVPTAQYPSYGGPLQNYMASVVYVYPPIATSELLGSLAQRGLNLIGESLPSNSLKSNWVASLKPDLLPVIQQIFPELLAGHGGQTLASPLSLADVNPDLLSAGKLRLVQEVLDGLQAGTIDTGVTP